MLFTREIGDGPPVLVLHGGPGFDHNYLLPELDRLAASHRLLYYDQRGRGRSAGGVRPEDVTIESEIADIDGVRAGAGAERIVVLGHSWGGLLAAEYAACHPERVSHLVLLDSAPLSHADASLWREHLRGLRTDAELEQLERLSASESYDRGDLAEDAAYLGIHFRPTVPPELLEPLVVRLRAHFTPETIVTARAIGRRLFEQTWDRDDYDLFPALRRLDVPTLVLHGTEDFIPVALAEKAAGAIPGARLEILPCGHFSFLERPEEVEREVSTFLGPQSRQA